MSKTSLATSSTCFAWPAMLRTARGRAAAMPAYTIQYVLGGERAQSLQYEYSVYLLLVFAERAGERAQKSEILRCRDLPSGCVGTVFFSGNVGNKNMGPQKWEKSVTIGTSDFYPSVDKKWLSSRQLQL
jgi:hypothetical protein